MKIDRRRLALLVAAAAEVALPSQATAQQGKKPANQDLLVRLWPGKTLKSPLSAVPDGYDEFFVRGPKDADFYETIQPEFIQAGGEDARKLTSSDLRDRFLSPAYINELTTSNETIAAAKGGPVLRAYQELLKTAQKEGRYPKSQLRAKVSKPLPK